ncbi:DUF2306 domain-containing protein [Thalassotalea maritima]|uniref:DUF2306 domain-containing protein n=1 Tax=Thalassotalea maritima TaxID=3242416 RepID=UPI0035285BF1
MEFFFQSTLGGFHTLSAIVALITGAMVFLRKKGNAQHKVYGYTYVVAMLALNISAIPLQNLFDGLGWFHLFIVISLPYIIWGMYYPLFARSNPNWMVNHFEILSYSYIGLCAAFIAEVVVRLPLQAMVGNVNQFIIGVFVIAFICAVMGYRVIRSYKTKHFAQS